MHASTGRRERRGRPALLLLLEVLLGVALLVLQLRRAGCVKVPVCTLLWLLLLLLLLHGQARQACAAAALLHGGEGASSSREVCITLQAAQQLALQLLSPICHTLFGVVLVAASCSLLLCWHADVGPQAEQAGHLCLLERLLGAAALRAAALALGVLAQLRQAAAAAGVCIQQVGLRLGAAVGCCCTMQGSCRVDVLCRAVQRHLARALRLPMAGRELRVLELGLLQQMQGCLTNGAVGLQRVHQLPVHRSAVCWLLQLLI
jgi:hypothetical protein